MRKKYLILAKAFTHKGKLLATATNDYEKSHPVMKYFATKVGLPEKEYLHAEIHAILRCKDKIPFLISVERYNNDGNMALAKPCNVCREAIKAYGVQFVKYTTSSGWVTECVEDW